MRLPIILAILVAFAAASAAQASADPLPRPDLPPTAPENLPPRPKGEGWRRFSNFEGATDSRCIGKLVNPTCTIETLYRATITDDPVLSNSTFVPQRRSDDDDVPLPRHDRPQIGHLKYAYNGPVRWGYLHSLGDIRACPPAADRMVIVQIAYCEYWSDQQVWACDRPDRRRLVAFFLRKIKGAWLIVGGCYARF
jgi:hypothetical protein